MLKDMENIDKFPVDPMFWEQLSSLDPSQVARRCLISFRDDGGYFKLPVLNENYLIYPKERIIVRENPRNQDDNRIPSSEFCIIVLHYLLKAKSVALTGKIISEKQIKGGSTFFRGPHALLVEPIRSRYESEAAGFLEAAEKLGARQVKYGDAAIELWPFPRIPVTYILWMKDEEFPARVSVLFDSSVEEHLPLDIVYGLVNVVTRRLIGAS